VVDLTLTDEQKDLRELAHSFAEKDIRKVAWDYDKEGTWPQDIIEKAWEIGLMNTHIAEEYGGPGLDFDFPVDPDEHSQSYRDALVSNLFYANNMIHDVMSRYGFDEASGNFQANNYGRGGTGGDYVRAEAADGNGTNNANFNPPVNDGGTPRMQMYLWPGAQFGSPNSVTVGTTTYNASYARYSPAPTPATTDVVQSMTDVGLTTCLLMPSSFGSSPNARPTSCGRCSTGIPSARPA